MKTISQFKQDLITGLVIYAFLLCMFFQTLNLLPASALFPRAVLLLMALLNTAMIVLGYRKKGEGNITWATIKMPLLYFGGVVVYAALYRFMGYFPSTAIMLIGLMMASKVRPWWKAALVTVVYLIFIYVLFVLWLKVRLI